MNYIFTVENKDSIAGFNLPNYNVNAMSLARTHLEMRTSFFEIGSNTDLRPAAVGPYWTPISQNFGPHFQMRPRQTHGILSL